MKKQFLFVLVAAVAIMASFNAEALTFNPFKRAGRVRANTLILSGNYVHSRLLADLAQYYSKQPVLLLSPDVDGAYQLFYLPAGNTATPVNADDFMTIVEYVNPRRIVVLGGDDFVPHKFIDLARSKYSVMILDSDDWNRNAITLGDLLKADKLALSFNQYKTNLEAVNK
ncbi:MAG: hypothetical protein J5746_09040 [Victivallales bacterium]|nr:hypothetical protein [Victivallales bacterium]